METTKAFLFVLRELVVDHEFVTRTGRPNWAAFASELEGFHYETVRQVAGGLRNPTPGLMEECARVLRLRPEYFLEYRIHLAQRDFDPAAVGVERAIENLALWRKARSGKAPPR
jgi:hypothetical protein